MTYMKAGESGRRIRNISELAKLAGVSAGTVSRALAGKDLVNRQTRERIQALAREHGFRPNQMASRLRTGHTGVIGAVVPQDGQSDQALWDPSLMVLVSHFVDAVSRRGYDLMLSRVIPSDDADWLERISDSGMLDGVLMTGQADQLAEIERVAANYRPMVVWGTHQPGQVHCSVGTDSFAAGRIAAQHLLGRGARRLAFIGQITDSETAKRLDGAREAVAASGTGAALEAVATNLAGGSSTDVAEQLARLDPATDGIIAGSDTIAMSVLRALHERGRKVPDEVAVIGYGDLPIATQTVPRLTTVHHDMAAGAEAMVDTLFRRLAGEDTGPTVLEPRLIVRESA